MKILLKVALGLTLAVVVSGAGYAVAVDLRHDAECRQLASQSNTRLKAIWLRECVPAGWLVAQGQAEARTQDESAPRTPVPGSNLSQLKAAAFWKTPVPSNNGWGNWGR